MYNESANKVTTTQEPDFQKVISMLRGEIARSEELSKSTNGIVAQLKPFSPNGAEASPKNEKQDGIIGVLFEEIFRLRQINYFNEVNLTHLKEIIGN